ncbi:tetratricopeptide repeat protein [Hymenobacter sp. RP-2-7]|uniref:Tetratricopeptide repeat protein n=1 Tax=Hymenobacter polaris TaxID=2682546 RepID=A0A7Y0AGT7_9BACT|nr:tetratricopeptide repeat protein [Hymenobacter polaris]NML67091.1 tetratricopeptide repeat protein [Hymenobacter polaris]
MKPTLFSTFCRWLGLGLLSAGAVACASDKSLVSHALNNVAARDNGFFLAREKLWATEATLYKGRANDYNQLLPLYPTLDSTTVRATRADLNDIVKKASLPIQHRPGSDWTDDAYLLVGWARFYKMEFDDAELTFKYVNSTSHDPIAKQEALIGLMRTFMQQKRPDDARAVSALLDKERGLPKDARELFLTRANYYLQAGEPKEAIPMLERAIPLIPAKNERSRTRYLLAQLYEGQGQEKAAAEQLNEILKRNPPYELDFNTKLLLAEVSDLDQQNTARLDKYFAALLKDEKNKEYRDRIYYQQARLAYRQKKYPEALALLRPAAKVPSPSKYQKGYTYLLAGRIYYENLQKYPLAAAYYDSAATAMPKDNSLYASVKERSDILKDFAKQYTIIQTQDSLQTLAKLPADELDKRLTTYAAAAIEAKRQAEAKALAAQLAAARQQAAAVNNITGSPAGFTGTAPAFTGDQRTAANPGTTDPLNAVASGALWYFDNPTSLATARTEFIRRWGDRKLQDNWRTLNTPSSSPNDPANGGAPVSLTGNDQTRVAGTTGQPGTAGPPDPLAEQKALATQYRQALPDTPAKLEVSNQQIEGAMYELGGIYKELLKEKQRGYETYAGEVQRYPRGAHAPDADYLLYLYYKDLPDPAKAAQYAAALQEYFPTSTYARLIADPQYREHERALHNAVTARLDAAFDLYKEQSFAKAKTAVADLERQYPKSDLADRVAYLKLLLAVRTQPPGAARASVQQFIKDFADSPLVAQAQALGAAYQKADAGQLAGAMASTEKPGVSQFRPGEVENRMRIVYGADESPYIDVAPAPAPSPAPAATATPTPAVVAPAAPAPADAIAAPVATAPSTAAPTAPNKGRASKPTKGKPDPTPTPSTTTTGADTPAAPAGTNAAPVASGTPAPTAAPATTGIPSPAPAPTSAPAVAYTTQLSAAHAVVLVYPKGQAPVGDLAAALTTYDNKFFRAAGLQVQPAQDLGTGQEMVVVRALPSAKVAQSYATKLRGPQSPLARLRGQGYETVVISLANLGLLEQSGGNVAGYQQFYQQVYQ